MCSDAHSITLRYFPADWSEGFIVPLHKKADTDDVGNYRGIILCYPLLVNYLQKF